MSESPQRMALMLMVMMGMGQVTWTPELVAFVLQLFVAYAIFQMTVSLWIRLKVVQRQDTRIIFVAPPKKPFTPEAGPRVKTTYVEHELKAANSFLLQAAMSTGMTLLLHLKFDINQVLLLQLVSGPLQLFDYALFKSEILGISLDRKWGELLEGEEEPPAPEPNTSADQDEQVAQEPPAPKSKNIDVSTCARCFRARSQFCQCRRSRSRFQCTAHNLASVLNASSLSTFMTNSFWLCPL
eukprot:NODE_4652_length_758_cov_49.483360_g4331_i1.p1 GENE.NODE_4652_length_758_cov_49.483360_g4331_i1~~NODE_4652_length_758_cov_49.483360_g4331_i1.p1  ORF type:complete len:252 (-),score=74.89 NODE_4652_length_758_cov_49.483360_g4331_i1:3-722(-)